MSRAPKGSHRSHSEATAMAGRIGGLIYLGCVLLGAGALIAMAEEAPATIFTVLVVFLPVAALTLTDDLVEVLPAWRVAVLAAVLSLISSVVLFGSSDALLVILSPWVSSSAMPVFWWLLMSWVLFAVGWRGSAWRSHMRMHGLVLLQGMLMVGAGELVDSERNLAIAGLAVVGYETGMLLLAMSLPPTVYDAPLEMMCPQCDYDLRGCESDICPECGEPIDERVQRELRRRRERLVQRAREEGEVTDD